MTERTIRNMAKELAGAFYEFNRSPSFRIAFPTVRDYIRGHMHLNDGTIKPYTPGWLFFVETARKMLIRMLERKDVHENLKEGIYAALLEDHSMAIAPQAANIFQVNGNGKK